MKKISLLSILLLFSHAVFCQDTTSEDKYEYAILILNPNPFQPRTLEIIYADGQVEKFADLATTDIGKNLYKNLQTLLKAFNYLGSKGYELINEPDNPKDTPRIENQYVFMKRYR